MLYEAVEIKLAEICANGYFL